MLACHSSQPTSPHESDDLPEVSFGDLADSSEDSISQSSKQDSQRLILKDLKDSGIFSSLIEDDDDDESSPNSLLLPLDLRFRNDSLIRQSAAKVLRMRHFDIKRNQPESATSKANDIESFMQEAHECMEGGEDEPIRNPRDFIKALMENYNFKKLFVNGYRWIQLKKSDPQYRDHALNVVYMLGISHGLETLSGPLGMMFASQEGASSKTMALIGTVGAIIAIPGLDPLCLVLMSVYKSQKGFQTAITRFRLISHKGFHLLNKIFLIPKLIETITHTNSAHTVLTGRSSNCRINWTYENKTNIQGRHPIRLFTSIEEQDDIQIDFYPQGDSLIAKSIEIKNQLLQRSPEELNKLIVSTKTFYKINWHLGYTMTEILEYLSRPSNQRPFFISSLRKTDVSTRVDLISQVIKIQPTYSIRNPLCQNAL